MNNISLKELQGIHDDLIQLLHTAGVDIKDSFNVKNTDIQRKKEAEGWHTDLTLQDIKTNKRIVEYLSEKYPSYTVVSEEEDIVEGNEKVFYVDPIDGTRNFIKKIPRFFSGVAFAINGQVLVSVTYNPARDETYSAIKGQGAYLNKNKIEVSKESEMVNVDLQLRTYPDKKLHGKLYLKFLPEVYQIKNEMSSHYELAGVSSGLFDAFVSKNSSPWDYCHYLLVEEAGGKVTNFDGREFNVHHDNHIVATNGIIHSHVLKIINN